MWSDPAQTLSGCAAEQERIKSNKIIVKNERHNQYCELAAGHSNGELYAGEWL